MGLSATNKRNQYKKSTTLIESLCKIDIDTKYKKNYGFCTSEMEMADIRK